jgi:hypothetical protein
MSDEENEKAKTPLETAVEGYENLQTILVGLCDLTTSLLHEGDVTNALGALAWVRSRIGSAPDDATKH